jgi:pSer/pThr/pTyr-binding forkhead associated (FHA) protein
VRLALARKRKEPREKLLVLFLGHFIDKPHRALNDVAGLGDLPFIVGRGPVAGEGLPPLQLDLKLDDTVPFRLSRNHFMIEKRDGNYYVRDLCSTLGTIVNGEPIGDHFRGDDAALRAGENEVIAGGVDSPFVFSVFIA